MPSKWPIRSKLLLGLALLVLVVSILSSTGLVATYEYRDLVNSLSWRVNELPLAAQLSQHVGDMRIALGELRGLRNGTIFDGTNLFTGPNPDLVPPRVWAARDQFCSQLNEVEQKLARYRDQLASETQTDPRMSDHRKEQETVQEIERKVAEIRAANRDEDWMLDNVKIDSLDKELRDLETLAAALPSYLHDKLKNLSHEVRGQYGVLIVSAWTATVSACLVFLLFVRLWYRWIFRPLQTLIAGSRRVAAGEFGYRIRIDTDDEMAELAQALNDMTSRFQEIRDDLDRQVEERTKQVVRSEQLASVGFLAAGVAHEINNPLASIAMCAESLEGRLRELPTPAGPGDCPNSGDCPNFRLSENGTVPFIAADLPVIGNYLRMIQTEAFRCKGITEKLLDFARIGPGQRQHTELGELVGGVLEMLNHLGKYQRKHIEFAPHDVLFALVNPQEIKQVVLNLLTNALDSLDDGGTVRICLEARDGYAELTVADDGCGMEPEVLDHIFEPFFTRRRGGQGIGLGLSITYRIIADHGGAIEAHSAGSGRGSTFRVRLPSHKETEHRRQAA